MASQTAELDPAWAAQDKGTGELVAMWVLMGVSLAFVASRLYVRRVMQKHLLTDDYLMILSMICGFVALGLISTAIHYGAGRHAATLTVDQLTNVGKFIMATFLPSVLSLALPKLAVIDLFTRILNPGPFHKAYLWSMGIFLVLVMIATAGLLLGRCTPVESLWDTSITDKYCYDQIYYTNWSYFVGALSAFLDFYLAVYPAVVLWKLQMPIRKKVFLCVILGIGAASGVVALYKTAGFSKLDSSDFSYDTTDLFFLTMLEGNLIMITSSVPVMQPLLDKLAKQPWVSNIWNRSGRTNTTQPDSERSVELKSSKKRASTKKLYPNLDITYQGNTRLDSQEEILNDKFSSNAKGTASGSDDDTTAHEKPSHDAKESSRHWDV